MIAVTAPGAAASHDVDLRQQVSALIDGECDAASRDRAIDALLASDDLARFWADAHRAGDWLRSDEVVGVGDGVACMRRISAALADEPALIALPKPVTRRTADRRFWTRTGLPGASIAAALVVVAWVAMPTVRPDASHAVAGDGTQAVRTIEVAKAPADAAAVTPVALKEIDVEPLRDYLAAHRDVTPFAYRGATVRNASYGVAATASNDTSVGSAASQ